MNIDSITSGQSRNRSARGDALDRDRSQIEEERGRTDQIARERVIGDQREADELRQTDDERTDEQARCPAEPRVRACLTATIDAGINEEDRERSRD